MYGWYCHYLFIKFAPIYSGKQFSQRFEVFGNQFIAQPNVPISVGSSDSSTSTIAQDQINAFTVENVDVPRPLPLAGAAGCGAASAAPLAFECRARG